MSDYWFTKSSKRILIEHMNIPNPSFELCKWIDSYVDTCSITLTSNPTKDIWYFLYGFTDKEFMFMVNNFTIDFKRKEDYRSFFDKTNGLSNQKEIGLKWIEINDIDKAIELCKKETFDLSLLDFLDGKITEAKMLNFGVGQVMKQYPKRFSPADVMAALKEKFKL